MNEEQMKQAAAYFGRIGGTKTRATYDNDHFKQIGRQGAAKRWAGHVKAKGRIGAK